MTQAKNYTIILIAMSLAFALGWTSQGYRIYGSMFQNTVNELPKIGQK